MRSRRASASSSELRAGRERLAASLAGIAASLVLCAPPAQAKVFHTRQEALEIAFPEAERIERRTTILDEERTRAIEQAAGAKVDSKLVTIFTAYRGEEILGYAHIDVHTVRTHPAALMVVLDPEGVVRSVRMLAFHEPLDYLPAEKWFAQLEGRTHGDRLRVGGDVHGVVNATLTTRAVTDSVRRALAYHRVLIAGGE